MTRPRPRRGRCIECGRVVVEKQADQEYLAIYGTEGPVWFDTDEDRALCMAGLYRHGHTTESENSL